MTNPRVYTSSEYMLGQKQAKKVERMIANAPAISKTGEGQISKKYFGPVLAENNVKKSVIEICK